MSEGNKDIYKVLYQQWKFPAHVTFILSSVAKTSHRAPLRPQEVLSKGGKQSIWWWALIMTKHYFVWRGRWVSIAGTQTSQTSGIATLRSTFMHTLPRCSAVFFLPCCDLLYPSLSPFQAKVFLNSYSMLMQSNSALQRLSSNSAQDGSLLSQGSL